MGKSSLPSFMLGVFLLSSAPVLGRESGPSIRAENSSTPVAGPSAKVWVVIDGDTLYLEKVGRVRLIGVDTPETSENPKLDYDVEHSHLSRASIETMGEQAKRFVEGLVGKSQVRLEYDEQRRDRFHRTLAYVYFRMPEGKFNRWVGEKNAEAPDVEKEYMLNRVLLKYGYAQVYRSTNYFYKKEFQVLETEARHAGRGLWREKKSSANLSELPAGPLNKKIPPP